MKVQRKSINDTIESTCCHCSTLMRLNIFMGDESQFAAVFASVAPFRVTFSDLPSFCR
jgi:hypothetical protein